METRPLQRLTASQALEMFQNTVNSDISFDDSELSDEEELLLQYDASSDSELSGDDVEWAFPHPSTSTSSAGESSSKKRKYANTSSRKPNVNDSKSQHWIWNEVDPSPETKTIK